MYTPRPKLSWTALLAAALLSGCASTSSEPPPPPAEPAAVGPAPTLTENVLGKTWVWIMLVSPSDEVLVQDPQRYTLQFDDDGFVFVQADCNRGQASFFLPAAGQLAITGMSVTRAACPAGSLSQRFVTSVELVRSWFMAEGNLMLELPGQTGVMRFRPRG